MKRKSQTPAKRLSNSFKIDIENYKTINKLKESPFSQIFSIKDKRTDQIYAAKVMLNDQNEQLKTIKREVGMLMLFQHPTIIKFYGYSLTDFDKKHQVTIIMDLANKGSLSDILKNARRGFADYNYDYTARQIILAGVARGMMFLHQHHVIHRDLKPGNILLDENFRPHITDFGLSKTYEIGDELFQSRPDKGLCYMAPELLNFQRYNGKVDVYSFGIIMYEILTDKVPFPLLKDKSIDDASFIDKVINENFRPDFNGITIKKSLRQLIEQCWAKDPNERPTFEEIFNKLAFNIENSVYDIYEENQDEVYNENNHADEDENKYYLDDIDVEYFLCYIDEITEGDAIEEIDPSLAAIEEIKKENEELRKQINNFTQQITELTKRTKAMQQDFELKIEEQSKINEKNNEKIKAYKKEIKILKKRLQVKDATENLLVDLTKYKKEKINGQHSKGIVYKGTPLSDNEKLDTIAIKAYQKNTSIEKESFINDVKLLSQLNHIAVLPIIGYSIPTSNDDFYSIISPYMVNGDLHQFIHSISKRKRPANWETIRAINIFGIAAGMAYLNEKKIIHNDLNSSSILLDENYQPKIGRINLPSFPERQTAELNRPVYIAPEFNNPDFEMTPENSSKVDVYSYAFILYELFSLSLPKFAPGSQPQIQIEGIPPIFCQLIELCWNQDSESRPTFSQIVKNFVDNKEEFLNFKGINKDVLSQYIDKASEGIESIKA